ncbi:hypothetical protein D9V29_03560 [Mycetocola manganoxydans]|uniref:HTH luxR-type domain-containing protein n=1 Tax=Mycetocola manganoxydans TaxID=699879 RepID=A0A3L7A0W8_9MICO|nr:AAA family ATPase [Mycetocola manganoxydans]RLP73092.1 hypothetical protein D9V29_03560 [Mycetocola manganoxydans]
MTAPRLPPDAAVPPTLLGRDRQLAGISRAVARVREGRAQFVLIEGEAGFGKTALLEASVATVPHWPVRSATADENETDLAYGVLNQLLRRVDEQDALDPVLQGGISPDVPTLVAGAALLNLIHSSEGATCVTIDDAQWLDQRSAEALWFAGRRSFRDRLLVIIAARPDDTAFLERVRLLVADEHRGVRLTVGGFGADPIAELVARRTGRQAPRRLVTKLVAATDGNALHVQTLLNQVVSSSDPLGSLDRMLLGTPPAAPGFRALTLDALRDASEVARAVVEIVAVLHDTATITDIAAVGERYAGFAITGNDIDDAVGTGLVTFAGNESAVVMPHERVRAVVVSNLALETRQAINAAAGQVIAGHRGLAHRANAAAGHDDSLADELNVAARLAAATHQADRAVRYARWSALLSSNPSVREERLIDAGVHGIAARRHDLLLAARSDFENLSSGPARDVLLGNVALATGDIDVARTHLSLAAQADPDGSSRARLMKAVAHQTLAATALLLDEFPATIHSATAVLEELPGLRVNASRVSAVSVDLDELEYNAVSWRALASWQLGLADTGQERLAELIAEGRRIGFRAQHTVLLLVHGFMLRQQGNLPAAIADLEAGIALADVSRPDMSPFGRINLSLALFRDGRWDAAAAAAAAAASIADDVEHSWARASAYAVAGLVPAARGDHSRAQEWLSKADAVPQKQHASGYRLLADFVRAVDARASGHGATAVFLSRRALATSGVHSYIEKSWWEMLLTEALGPAAEHAPDPLAVLSSREREVAHLAAQGLTNREVAHKLFVSVKGVEYHMGNVLAKLGLSSRRGIRGLIEGN